MNIRSVRNAGYDGIFGVLLWRYSLAIKLSLKVGFVYPFVVIDPCPGLMLENLLLIPDTEYLPFTYGNKPVSVWECHGVC